MNHDIKELGADQWIWLNKFKSIDLTNWRIEVIKNKPEWCYVSNWKPLNAESYRERKANLESNKYFYWPHK